MGTRVVSISSALRSHVGMQAIEGKQESRTELVRSVYARVHIHGKTLREIGKSEGLKDNEILELLVEGQQEHEQKAIRLAWDNGRRSLLPPCSVLRRAA